MNKKIATILFLIFVLTGCEQNLGGGKPNDTHNIDTILQNTPADERAKIKGEAIASKLQNKIEQRSKYKIEIVDTKPIEKGVEIYARVWENGKQFGFGKDGSVDIERFVFINPPILVDDPNGDIVREWVDSITGEKKQRKLKEDPKEAILQALSHTISVKKQKFDDKNIKKDKVGNTTTTVYPDSDGMVERNNANSDFTALRDGAGTDSYTGELIIIFQAGTSSNLWSRLFRGQAKFDTSSIPDTDSIDSAVCSIYGSTKQDPSSNTPNVNIYSSPDTALAISDYENSGTTAFSTAITYASWDTAGYNDFTLNASGEANIDKAGTSAFSFRNSNYDVADVDPTWGSAQQSGLWGYSSVAAGTANDPKLVVEHTAPVVEEPKRNTKPIIFN